MTTSRAADLLILPRDLTEDESAEVKAIIRAGTDVLTLALAARWLTEAAEVLDETDRPDAWH